MTVSMLIQFLNCIEDKSQQVHVVDYENCSSSEIVDAIEVRATTNNALHPSGVSLIIDSE